MANVYRLADARARRRQSQQSRKVHAALAAPGLTWHPTGDVRVRVDVPNEGTVSVLVPASTVVAALRRASQEEGLAVPSHVGDVDIVGWFGSKIWKKAKKAVKGVAKKAAKVVKKTVKVVKKAAYHGAIVWRTAYKYAGKPALKLGAKLAKSKEFGALLMASAAVCPAVGGPALAAYVVANRAAAAVRVGGAAGKAAVANIKRVAHGKSPTLNQKYLKAALRSVAA